MKIIGVVEARNNESHHDTNAFIQLAKKPALFHVAERMIEAQLIDEVVLDASMDDRGQPVMEIGHDLNIRVRRTAERDILKRLEAIAIVSGAEAVVITHGRSPLLFPSIIDGVIGHFLASKADWVSTAGGKPGESDPRALEVEVISRRGLEKLMAHHRSDWDVDRLAIAAHETPTIEVSVWEHTPEGDSMNQLLMIEREDHLVALQQAFGELYRAGVPVDLKELTAAASDALGTERATKRKKTK